MPSRAIKSGAAAEKSRTYALVAWAKIYQALEASGRPEDQRLAAAIARYVNQMPVAVERQKRMEQQRRTERERQREFPGVARAPATRAVTREREPRDIER